MVAQKRELENDIARWDDKAYVTAQARDRLGFVFPGEQAIRVEHPEAVDRRRASRKKGRHTTNHRKPPCRGYKELAYSFKQADRSDPVKADSTKQSQHAGEEDKQDSQDERLANRYRTVQQPSEDGQE